MSFVRDNMPALMFGGMVLFMLISEIVIDRPLFPNAYNWFHM